MTDTRTVVINFDNPLQGYAALPAPRIVRDEVCRRLGIRETPYSRVVCYLCGYRSLSPQTRWRMLYKWNDSWRFSFLWREIGRLCDYGDLNQAKRFFDYWDLRRRCRTVEYTDSIELDANCFADCVKVTAEDNSDEFVRRLKARLERDVDSLARNLDECVGRLAEEINSLKQQVRKLDSAS